MAKKEERRRISTFDDIYGSTVDEKEKIVEVYLSDLHPFSNHPYKVLDDESMDELVESIKESGVVNAGIVRERLRGGYEIISGHRRKRACELAGIDKMPVVIRNLSDDEAAIFMVDSNLQRSVILPSEKAKAYRMKYEALKHQGSKDSGYTLGELSESAGTSTKTIQRYIWLSRLSDNLLELVDTKALGFTQGVDISFLDADMQELVFNYVWENSINMTTSQSALIKQHSKSGELTEAVIKLILSQEKPKDKSFTIKKDRIREYFGEDRSMEDIEAIIFRLLDEWKEKGGGQP